MRFLILAALAAFSFAAHAADLQTTWDAVTVDDTGAPLTVPIDAYRVYACGGALIGSTTGAQTQYTEPNVTTGNYCREVTAVIGAFEGARGTGSLILVAPGAVQNVNVQAIP